MKRVVCNYLRVYSYVDKYSICARYKQRIYIYISVFRVSKTNMWVSLGSGAKPSAFRHNPGADSKPKSTGETEAQMSKKKHSTIFIE